MQEYTNSLQPNVNGCDPEAAEVSLCNAEPAAAVQGCLEVLQLHWRLSVSKV